MSLNSTQLALLKTELQNDPKSLGYAALLSVGNDSGVADAINLVRSGGDFQRPSEPVAGSTITALITPEDLAAMTGTQVNNLGMLLSSGIVDLNAGNNLANILSCLPNAGTSRTAVNALSLRNGSRGEVLFATNGIVVSSNDVSNAQQLP